MPPEPGATTARFALDVDGLVVGALREVTGLKLEQDVIELRENAPDGRVVVRRLPGRWTSGDVTVIRDLTADSGLRQWVKDSQAGPPEAARRNGSIVVFDADGRAVQRFLLHGAWPRSYELGARPDGDGSTAIETLVLVCERLELE